MSQETPTPAAAEQTSVEQPAAQQPAASTAPDAQSLGYLELLRVPDADTKTPDPTDRVLSHPRPSAWDF